MEGNEILFGPDRREADAELMAQTVRLLRVLRAELLGTVQGVPDALLDWDPPYRRFRGWATWRTVRQVLAHVANTETHYYLPNIGIRPEIEPAAATGPWEDQLTGRRGWTEERLLELVRSGDLARVRSDDVHGGWSVRKVLRRLVWHERLHTKSIQRIVRAYRAQHPDRGQV